MVSVPDICSPLIGHGWARVPPQIQCTTTSAAEEDKKAKGQEQRWVRKEREKEEDWLITQNQQRPQEQRSDPRSLEGQRMAAWLNEAAPCFIVLTFSSMHWPSKALWSLKFIFHCNYNYDSFNPEKNIHSLHSRQLKLTIKTNQKHSGGENYELFFLTHTSCIYSVWYLPFKFHYPNFFLCSPPLCFCTCKQGNGMSFTTLKN